VGCGPGIRGSGAVDRPRDGGFCMKWSVKLGVLFACAFAAVALLWMAFLPALVDHELRAVTGFDFHVAVLSADPFTGHVSVRGLSARNPPAYPDPDFIEVRELRGDVGLFSWLFSKRIVIDDLTIDIEKIVLVRTHDGKTNAGEFMAAFSKPREAGSGPAPAPRKPTPYLIKKLHLNFDRLVVVDFSGSKKDEKVYALHIDETFINVADSRQLLVPQVLRNLQSFGLHHDIAQLLPGDFGKALAGAVGSLKDTAAKTGSYLKSFLDKLEQKPNP
jgi:hypothetical protein